LNACDRGIQHLHSVADDFARKITEGVVKDEYTPNFGEVWLKDHFEESKAELEQANRQPIV